MNYVLVNNNKVIFGPRAWNKGLFEAVILQDIGITVTLDLADPGKFVTLSSTASLLPVVNTTTPTFNSTTQTLTGPTWALTATTATQVFGVMNKSVVMAQNDLKTQAAALRYQAEIAGTTAVVSGTTVSVTTDRVGKQIYYQQFSTATATPVAFKFGSQWLNANVTDFGNIVTAINNHVQKTFNWEANVVVQIDSTTVLTELANIKLPTSANIATQ